MGRANEVSEGARLLDMVNSIATCTGDLTYYHSPKVNNGLIG